MTFEFIKHFKNNYIEYFLRKSKKNSTCEIFILLFQENLIHKDVNDKNYIIPFLKKPNKIILMRFVSYHMRGISSQDIFLTRIIAYLFSKNLIK
jgi:hypothetical protein